MTICHLISSEGYYGAEAMLLALARSERKLGCRCVLGVFQDCRCAHTEVAERARQFGLPVSLIPSRGRWDWGVVGRIRHLLDAEGVDVLHTHGYKADFYGYIATFGKQAALFATCHNWPSKLPLMRGYAALDRGLLRRFDGVAAVSDTVAGILRKWGFSGPKVSTIPNGVDVESFTGSAPRLRRELHWGDRPVIGFVGRLVAAKGGEVLLQAARTVLQQHPATLFAFIGDGPARPDWESMAAQLGIAPSVTFLGVRQDMPAVYASIDALVLPSENEATPMCILEAMAAAKPVIATPVGSVKDIVVPGVTGFLIPVGDADGLADTIIHVLADPRRAKELGFNGRRHVARFFSAERMAATYVGRYLRILGASPANANAPLGM